ncbi:cytochrome c oxidase subunit NDUFA4-like [Musca vetustissima]|uniref:cytochrome c oxidase subunit NDUFA4-like n=1 Tax=Musca vetustissima TaxID=27455 RepID=UPI002AB7E752|nr:cytochrome c oxidase subunit NDUFA4-like [Musca vetustissima]XP_061400330.1 cytochrome c oxidase subunit NDUFA4-like [Musca vetustissima]
MQGLSLKSIKKNPALIPLYVCVGAGALASALYTLRLATRNPDVTWNRSANPEPWEEYKEKQYKFYSPIRDYSKVKSPAPNYDEE